MTGCRSDMMPVWLLILTIAGKLTALAKDIAFAGAFGAGSAADAYFVAYQIPGIIWLVVLGTIVPVFAPLYVQRLGDTKAAARLANEAIRYYFYAAIALTILGLLGANWLVGLIAPFLDDKTHALAVELTRIMVLGFALTSYVGVQSAIQQSNGRFIPPLAVPVVNNLLATLAIFLAWYWGNVAIAVAGAVGAYLVQAVIQRLQTLKYYATEFRFSISGDVVKRLSLLSAPVGFVLILDQLNILVGNAFASGFGSGAVAQFNYANRLALFVAGVFSWLVSYVFFPALAHSAANADDKANAALITRALAIILVATAPAAAGALAMRSDIVAFIYQRGAFGSEDVVVTASLFGVLGIGIIFAATRELLNRVFFSHQRTAAPLAAGVVAICVNIALCFWLIPQFGLPAIALGNAAGAFTFFICQLALLRLWKPLLLQRRLLFYSSAVLIAGVAGFFAATGADNLLPTAWPVLVRMPLAGLALLLAYFPALAILLTLLRISPRIVLAELTGKSMLTPDQTSDDIRNG